MKNVKLKLTKAKQICGKKQWKAQEKVKNETDGILKTVLVNKKQEKEDQK